MGADAVGQGEMTSVQIDLPLGANLGFGVPMIPEPPRPKAKKPRNSEPRVKKLPEDLNGDGPDCNAIYEQAIHDPGMVLSPQQLRFLPSSYWLNQDSTFGDIVTKFFQRKNNANCRFPHKLFNALAIVENDDSMWNLIGARWINDSVFKIDKLIFGRLLGIQSIEGGLFHKQGNFPSHGFVELSLAEMDEMKKAGLPVMDVDMDRYRLLHHPGGLFVHGSDEDTINKCKWVTTGLPK